MNEQLAVQRLLQRKLAEGRSHNARYSLRSLAKRAGLQPGAVSGILSGKRFVSAKLAERIAQNLLLDPQERAELLGAFPRRRAPATERKDDPQYLQLSALHYKIIAGWEHYALLSLLKVKGFRNDPLWISKRLGISATAASQALARLLELGLVRHSKNGLERAQSRFRSSDDHADLSVRRSHEQGLELAKESLHRDPVPVRDLSSITMAIDPALIPRAKEAIRRFQDELAAILEQGEATEVYRFSAQLFPLTKLSGDTK